VSPCDRNSRTLPLADFLCFTIPFTLSQNRKQAAGTDHTFEISAATSTNNDVVHVPGPFGTAKFVVTIKNEGPAIRGDAVTVGISTKPVWNEPNIPSLQLALCQTLAGVNCFYWNTTTHQRVFDNSNTYNVWRQDWTVAPGDEDMWQVGQTRKFIFRVVGTGRTVGWNQYLNRVYSVVHNPNAGVDEEILDDFGFRWAMDGLSVTTQ